MPAKVSGPRTDVGCWGMINQLSSPLSRTHSETWPSLRRAASTCRTWVGTSPSFSETPLHSWPCYPSDDKNNSNTSSYLFECLILSWLCVQHLKSLQGPNGKKKQKKKGEIGSLSFLLVNKLKVTNASFFFLTDYRFIKKVDFRHRQWWLPPRLPAQYWWKWSAWQFQKGCAGQWVACGSSFGIDPKS